MEAPKTWSIFKNIRRQPNRFRYQPKHYDAKQDELEKRLKRIEQRVNGTEDGDNIDRQKPEFDFRKSKRQLKSNYRSGLAAANWRLLVILIVLIAMFAAGVRWLDNIEM